MLFCIHYRSLSFELQPCQTLYWQVDRLDSPCPGQENDFGSMMSRAAPEGGNTPEVWSICSSRLHLIQVSAARGPSYMASYGVSPAQKNGKKLERTQTGTRSGTPSSVQAFLSRVTLPLYSASASGLTNGVSGVSASAQRASSFSAGDSRDQASCCAESILSS